MFGWISWDQPFLRPGHDLRPITSETARLEGYARLLRIGRELAATRHPQNLYALIHEQAATLLPGSAFCLSVVDGCSDRARVVYCVADGRRHDASVTYPTSDSLAMQRGRAVIHPLDEYDPALTAVGFAPDGRMCMSAALVREGQVLGGLCMLSPHEGSFDDWSLELLASLADLAAVALDNARFVEELDRQRAQAERLEEIGRAITSSLELEQVLERVTSAARELLGADGATVWLARGAKHARAAFSSGSTNTVGGKPVRLPTALVEVMGMRREPVFFERSDDDFLTDELREQIEAESILAVPLVAEDRVLGALTIGQREKRAFTPHEVRLLQQLADQAAIAVNNARLHERLTALSLTDPLTGLANRRHVELFLDKEFAAAQRGRRLTVLLFDLDDFKRYNDTMGHRAGDEVLRRFADILQQQTRTMNLVGRWGGDEFLSILADTDRDGAFISAGRIAQRVDEDPFLGANGVTFSVGTAVYTPEFTTADELIHAADVDLYEAKHSRDREIRD